MRIVLIVCWVCYLDVVCCLNIAQTRQIDIKKRLTSLSFVILGLLAGLLAVAFHSDVLDSSELRVDQMKLYPHAVVPWTVTKKWLDDGRFKPYSHEELCELLVWFKKRVHPWIRLNRIVRDIPGHYISGGNAKTNLRQVRLQLVMLVAKQT